jgi:hypothetical protein
MGVPAKQANETTVNPTPSRILIACQFDGVVFFNDVPSFGDVISKTGEQRTHQ